MTEITQITKNINNLSESLNKNVFITQARNSFKDGIDTFDMSDEEKAKILAQYEANLSIGVLNNIITKSFDLVELDSRIELLNKQIETENINQKIKDQQEIAEKIKNGSVSYIYTYYQATDAEVVAGTKKAGDIKTKTLSTGIGKSIYEIEKDKLLLEITTFEEKWNKEEKILDEQIETENINQKIKDQQEIAEKIKNGSVSYIYTYYQATDAEVVAGTKKAGDIKTKTLSTGIGKSIYEIEMEKLLQEILENKEKWNKQKTIVDNQVSMSTIDANYKATLVAKDVAIKEKQLSQMASDIEFNNAKKIIMELTRKDNIRMKSAEMFAEFLKYLSAANVIPATEDFGNIRALIVAIQQGMVNQDAIAWISSPIGAQYTKPV